MERERLLQALQADGELLLDAARGHLDAPVPTCPGWTVDDAVRHVAEVYEHKLAAIALRGEQPQPWPPAWPADRDPLDWCADAHGRLLATLAATDPAAPSWTWLPEDQTAGFWVRRMAQETAVHRVDVQSATHAVTPVDADLAADGVDEVLTLMLAGDWADEPQPGSEGVSLVEAGPVAFRVELAPTWVTVERVPAGHGGSGAGRAGPATVSGDPSAVLLWLWGRAGDDAVRLGGDPAVAARLRDRLRLATQ